LAGFSSIVASLVRERDASTPSNREAAQALFVTEKTIEAHLSRTYGKLNIHSRHELTHALATNESRKPG